MCTVSVVADYPRLTTLRVAAGRTRARHHCQNNVRDENQYHGLCCRQLHMFGTKLAVSQQLNTIDQDMDTI